MNNWSWNNIYLFFKYGFIVFEGHQLGSLILQRYLVDGELTDGRLVLAHDFIQLHFEIVDLRLEVAALSVGAEVFVFGIAAKTQRLFQLLLSVEQLLLGVLASFQGSSSCKLGILKLQTIKKINSMLKYHHHVLDVSSS